MWRLTIIIFVLWYLFHDALSEQYRGLFTIRNHQLQNGEVYEDIVRILIYV